MSRSFWVSAFDGWRNGGIERTVTIYAYGWNGILNLVILRFYFQREISSAILLSFFNCRVPQIKIYRFL